MPPITRKQFAEKLKAKYPQYASIDDNELVNKIVAKYPNYKSEISDFDVVAQPEKKKSGASPSELGVTPSQLPAQKNNPALPFSQFGTVSKETKEQPTPESPFGELGGTIFKLASAGAKVKGKLDEVASATTKGKKQPLFGDLEQAYETKRNAQSKLLSADSYATSNEIPQSEIDRYNEQYNQDIKAADEQIRVQKNLIMPMANAMASTVEGNWKGFIQDGVVDYEKIYKLADQMSKRYGGGGNVKEDLAAAMIQAANAGYVRNEADKKFKEKTGMTVDEMISDKKSKGELDQNAISDIENIFKSSVNDFLEGQQQTKEAVASALPLMNKVGAAFISALQGGIASQGSGLAALGVNNSFTDYLRGYKTGAKQMELPQKEWTKENLLSDPIGTVLPFIAQQAGTSLPSMAAAMATGLATGSGPAGAIVSILGEKAANVGDTYEQLIESGMPQDVAKERAAELMRPMITDALNFIEMDILLKAVKGKGNLLVNALGSGLAEVPPEYQQQWEQERAMNPDITVSEFWDKVGGAELGIKTFVSAGAMGAGASTVGKVYNVLSQKIPNSVSQRIQSIVQESGADAAKEAIAAQAEDGVLTEGEVTELQAKVDEVEKIDQSLEAVGVKPEARQMAAAISEQISELDKKMAGQTSPAILSTLVQQRQVLQQEMDDVISGKKGFVVVTPETGASYTVTGEAAKEVVSELDSEIKNGEVSVKKVGKVDVEIPKVQKPRRVTKISPAMLPELENEAVYTPSGIKEAEVAEVVPDKVRKEQKVAENDTLRKKEIEENADTARIMLDEHGVDGEGGVLTLQEKDNIHGAINDYEDGKISGEELYKEMLANGMKKGFIAKYFDEKLYTTPPSKKGQAVVGDANGKERGDALERIGVDRQAPDGLQRKEWSEARDYNLGRAIGIAENQLNSNPNSKIGSIPMNAANAIRAELEMIGIKTTDKTPISEVIDKLKTLEQSLPTQSETKTKAVGDAKGETESNINGIFGKPSANSLEKIGEIVNKTLDKEQVITAQIPKVEDITVYGLPENASALQFIDRDNERRMVAYDAKGQQVKSFSKATREDYINLVKRIADETYGKSEQSLPTQSETKTQESEKSQATPLQKAEESKVIPLLKAKEEVVSEPIQEAPKAEEKVSQPKQGDTVTIVSKTDGKAIDYYRKEDGWYFRDSRGKEQKESPKGQDAVTEEWRNSQGLQKEVSVYHGSPHSFQKFTTEKIGTGEGAQVFGWGLYFTDLESIAKEYARKLSKKGNNGVYPTPSGGTWVLGDGAFGSLVKRAIQSKDSDIAIRILNKGIVNDGLTNSEINGIRKLIKEMDDGIWDNIFSSKPNVYKVSLHKGKEIGQYDWIVWDKDVPKSLMDKIGEKLVSNGVKLKDYFPYTPNGQNLYSLVSKILGSDKEASLFLLKNGIDGVKYPAESIARGANSDTARGFNYVVFDENAVTIEEQIQFDKSKIQLEGGVFVDATEYVDKAESVLKALFPDAAFKVYKTSDSYVKATGDTEGRGSYNPKTNTVAINLQKMQESGVVKTPIHEVVHPIVKAAAAKNPNAIKKMWQDMDELKSIDGMELVWNHVSNYSAGQKAEEGITEFITRVVDGSIRIESAPKSLLTKIIDLINKVFNAVGIDFNIERPSDLLNLSNAVKKAFDTGNIVAVSKLIDTQSIGRIDESILQDKGGSEFENWLSENYELNPDLTADDFLEAIEEDIPSAVDTKVKKDALRERIEQFLEGQKVVPPQAPPPTQSSAAVLPPKDVFGITHAATEDSRVALGLPLYEKTTIESIESIEAKATKEIKDGFDYEEAINRVLNGAGIWTPVEQNVMGKYLAALEEKTSENPTNENLEAYTRVLLANDQNRSAYGRALGIARWGVWVEGTLADFLVSQKKALGGIQLSEERMAQNKKEFEEIQAAAKAWEKKYNDLKNKVAEKQAQDNVNKKKKETKPTNRTKEQIREDRKKIFQDIRDDIAKARQGKKIQIDGKDVDVSENNLVPRMQELLAIAKHIPALMESYIAEGILDVKDMAKRIVDEFKSDIPDMTYEDAAALIAGEFDSKKKPLRSELNKEIFELRKEMDLIRKIEKLDSGEVPKTPEKRERKESKLKALRDKIKAHPNMQLPIYKKNIQTQISKIENEIKKGNFTESPKKVIIPLDDEARALKKKLIDLKKERQVRLLHEEYANRSRIRKVTDEVVKIFNIPRTIQASVDYSAPLRQGIIASIAHPVIAKSAFKEMFKASFKQRNLDEWFFDLTESGELDTMKGFGLALSDPSNPFLQAKEEAFMSGYVEKAESFIGSKVFKDPNVGLVKGSERAYVMYLNKLRADIFTLYADKFHDNGRTYENSPELYEQLAKYINNITGRGNMGFLESAAPVLSAAFFSPRFIAARVNELFIYPFTSWKLQPEIRNMFWLDAAKTWGLIGLTLGMAKLFMMFGDDDEETDVELDPRSTDFLQIKSGDKRWDITGGMAQYFRYFTQWSMGEKKLTTSGEVVEITGEAAFGEGRGDLMLRFVRNKTSPIVSTAWNLSTGRNAIGEKVTYKDEFLRNVTPITISQAIETASKDGMLGLLPTAVPAAFGVGFMEYDSNKIEMANGVAVGAKKYKLSDSRQKEIQSLAEEKLAIAIKKVEAMPEYKAADKKAKSEMLSMTKKLVKKATVSEFIKKHEKDYPKETETEYRSRKEAEFKEAQAKRELERKIN